MQDVILKKFWTNYTYMYLEKYSRYCSVSFFYNIYLWFVWQLSPLFCNLKTILLLIIYCAKLIMNHTVWFFFALSHAMQCIVSGLLFRITQTCGQFLMIVLDELRLNYMYIIIHVSKETEFEFIYFNGSSNYNVPWKQLLIDVHDREYLIQNM